MNVKPIATYRICPETSLSVVVGRKNSAEIQAELLDEWSDYDRHWRHSVFMYTAGQSAWSLVLFLVLCHTAAKN